MPTADPGMEPDRMDAPPSESDRLGEERETTVPRRRRSSGRSVSRERNRLRLLYFSLASLWGFLIGTLTLLVGLSLVGRPVRVGPVGYSMLAAAATLAVAGGFVVSAAYRDASRRRRL